MSTEQVRFRLNAFLSILPPVLFSVFTIAWVTGLVLYWTELTWLVRIPSVFFIAWLLSWWTRFFPSLGRWRRGETTIFINLPWRVIMDDGVLRIRGFLLHVDAKPGHIVDVGGELPGLNRIVVRIDGKPRTLSIFGGHREVARILEWCFYYGVALAKRSEPPI